LTPGAQHARKKKRLKAGKITGVRFVIASGTGADEIVDWRPDARSARQHAMHLIHLGTPNIRIFDPDGHRMSLEELRDLAGAKGKKGRRGC
jgi:hypothetical protein